MIIGGSFTEREIGGNWDLPVTRADKVEGGYRIRGRKSFGTLAPIVDFIGVTATLAGGEKAGYIGTFFVPNNAPGLTVIENWDTMGMRATGSHDVVFEDVFAADAQLAVTSEPGALNIGGVAGMAWFSVSIASVYTGIAQAARDYAVQNASTRKLAFMAQPLGSLPGIQFATAEMDITLEAMRALTRRVAERWMDGEFRSEAGLGEVMKAKYFATNSAIQVVNQAMNVVGAWSIFREAPLERYYRDVRPGPFHPLNNDLIREAIGKSAYGIPMNQQPRWG
jgi:alkylation response protein AidB-like acyl-CoA dehydrogenase